MKKLAVASDSAPTKKLAAVKSAARAKKPVPVSDPEPTQGQGKYFLRSLHQEIDLYDRKLAYLANYEVFATEEDRATAEKKLTTKRAALASAARELAAKGVEYNPLELPRSFRIEAEQLQQN